eukprot:11998315-Heterocapsa_arctica.AAC.2
MATDNVAHMLYTKATTGVCTQTAINAQDSSVLYTPKLLRSQPTHRLLSYVQPDRTLKLDKLR